ncbi:DUF952 domain-containing protein [Streptomyces ovatisporus]|uniref:DUF952 domain-containing protein n=1 Tax=Streptomyces ovatisporus TaxID=1128682 RepID=A0ABV9AE55_9ACTN
MAELLHITERSLWESARPSGRYEMSTRGRTLEEEGFIHCSLRHQLPQVAKMLYADTDPAELVVLVIDSERISAPVRYEAPVPDAASGPGTEKYPHVYGPLPVEAVVAEEAWEGQAGKAE